MKSRFPILIAVAAGGLIGFLGVRLSMAGMKEAGPDRVEEPRHADGHGADAPSTATEKSGGKRTPDKRRTFAGLLKNAPVLFERSRPFGDLERMDPGQLKSIILDCLPHINANSTPTDRNAYQGVMSSAVRELYKREGDKALDWAAAEVPASQRSMVLSELLKVVAKDSPDTMKVWADRYRGEYGDQWAAQFHDAAIAGAIGRGAEELLRVRDELLKTRVMPYGTPDFPDDFDFHLFITKSKPDFLFQDTVAQWAARDKEAAWSGVKEVISNNQGNGASYFGALFRGVVATEGDEKAASWLAGKLGGMPDVGRDRAIQSLGIFPLGNEVISSLVRAFPDSADKVTYASYQFSTLRPGAGVVALRALDSPQLQTAALSSAAARVAPHLNASPQSDKTRAQFNSAMDDLQLDPQSREKILSTLSGSQPGKE